MKNKFKNACMSITKMMKQVTPPGMEPVVKALKKKSGVDNPWAVAWSMYGEGKQKTKQANAANAISQLLRSKQMKMKCSESATFKEVKQSKIDTGDGVKEGHICDVVLITEGLGNRRNMNYYGPEAIQSAPMVFEGKPCFMDHPSESEERDIPERRVRQKVGYFKNCRVENLEGSVSCLGEIHFDLSEDGEQAYKKACTALHYRDEFPGIDSEYVGLSINADGDVEDRTVQWEGETLQVNYVTRFRDAMSCDIVTSPARGGRFLALVESAAGANTKSKEVGPMKKGLQKSLEAAQTALSEAEKEKDLKVKAEKITEAKKLFDAFMKEAAKAAYQQDESEDGEEAEDGEESEDESKKKQSEDGEEAEDEAKKKKGEDEADDAPSDKKKSDDDDAVESKRVAIVSMAKEAGLELPKGKIERLVKGTIKEAKAEIADLKWMQESIAKKVVKGMKVPVASFAKVTESDQGSNEDSDLLASCIR